MLRSLEVVPCLEIEAASSWPWPDWRTRSVKRHCCSEDKFNKMSKPDQFNSWASAGEGKWGPLPPPPWPTKIVCFSTFF